VALWTREREYETLPLDDYKASRGAYLGAVIDDAWQGSPLPSLLRWAERQQMEYGPLGALTRSTALGMALPGLAREGLEALGAPADAFKPQGKVLTAQEVVDRSKPLGLNLRRGMSEAAFESIAAERRRQLANEAVFDRARAGTSLQIAGVLAEFATGAVDPFNLASAFLPVSRLGPVARALERIGSRDARLLARGAIEGAAGAVAVEPLVASAALDENPAYGFSSGLLNVAFGGALGGGLHWLGGRISGADRPLEAPRAPQRSAADVLRAESAETPPSARPAAPERAPAGEQPRAEPASTLPASADVQATARAVEKMSPEARQTLLDTVVRQTANDLAVDVDVLARATGQFIAPPARYPAQVRALGARWDVSVEDLRAEAREYRTAIADLEQRLAASEEKGARFTRPEGWQPTPALLAQAKAYVTPPKGKAEPERLATFVRRKGGLAADDPLAGDLRAQDLGRTGLLRKVKYQGISTTRSAGQTFDDMALAATEAGYFPERPTAEQFVAALIEDAGAEPGKPGARYSTKADQADLADFVTAKEERAAFERWMEEHPLGDPRQMAPEDLAYLLSLDPTSRRLAELDDLLARGVISEREALERAALLDKARAADEAAEAQAMLEIIAQARREMADQGPTIDAHKTTWLDTRGQGQQFHGTSRPIAELDDWAASTMNIYGQGFYTTDAVDIARGYTKKGKGQQPTLYRVTDEGGPHNLYDMEKPLSAEHRAAIEKQHLDGFYETYADQLAEAKTLREFYDEVRAESRENGHSADTIQELFDGIRAMFEAEGYRGFTHLGGLKTGKQPHHVAIYWFPSTDVKIAPVDWRAYEVAGRADEGAPLTREEFDAVERSIAEVEARGERLPEGDGEPGYAGLGEDARAPGAAGEFGPAADRGAVSGALPSRALGGQETLGGYDLSGWVQRQADWRADAHVDAPAAARADALIAGREAVTPEKDLADLEAAAAKPLTDEDKAELKLAEEPYNEAAALSDAYAQCKIGGANGG